MLVNSAALAESVSFCPDLAQFGRVHSCAGLSGLFWHASFAQHDLQEYLGSYVADENGRLAFREGALVTAVRCGHWVVLDELNLAPGEVLEALNRHAVRALTPYGALENHPALSRCSLCAVELRLAHMTFAVADHVPVSVLLSQI